jgi:pimeloyl-ACP methyl ester carboxylesterase
MILLAVPSAAGAGASAPTKQQQKCITSLSSAAAALAKARAAEDARCLETNAKGGLTESLRSCMVRDSKGKLAKQVGKLEQVVAETCSGAGEPDFGIGTGAPGRVIHAAAAAATGVTLDLLSENLFATALSCDLDKKGCACQEAAVKGLAGLANAQLATFGRCAKGALKDGISTSDELEGCLDDPAVASSVAADPKGKLAKKATKLGKTLDKRCRDVLSPSALPGQCAGLEGEPRGVCAGEIARCRACLSLNATHGLAADCDLLDDEQDDGSCPGGAIAQETVLLPSPAQGPHTPGSPGVVVTNPKLLAQFGGADFDLNHAIYTRYHLRSDPAAQPDAILVLVPGFEGGAGGFKVLAENLIARAFAQRGLVLEVWAYDRRGHQLEDLAGLDLAEERLDAQLALDWLFGDELGLPPNPELGRRAEFYNAQDHIPFLADWTPLLHSRDIDQVIDAARAAARNENVFLGGHSAGTGFTARYAATDFEPTGAGPAAPGYSKLRGLVLIEGGGGSTSGAAPDEETLDLIEAKFDGGLFGAVRDGEARCADGTTPCTPETEEVDCAALANDQCVPSVTSYAFLSLLTPQLLASADPIAIQASVDPDGGKAILLEEQGGIPGNTAISAVPELNILNVLPAATAQGAIGLFVDDEGFAASQASFVATSVGAPGPEVDGLVTWLDSDEAAAFPPCPAQCVTPDNGDPPTSLPASIWGVEQEAIRMDRFVPGLYLGATNFTDWYYPQSGLSVTQGLPSLDSSSLSLDPPAGRGRRDIENLTQAAFVDVPVIAFGGSNGLTPVPASFLPFASSIAPCAAPSCDGTARVVDASNPSAAFPTFGGAPGGFEVYVTEGYAHVDPLAAEDGTLNLIVGPLMDFLARNAP